MGVKEEEKKETDVDIITSKSTSDSSSPVNHSQNLGPARLSSSSTESDVGRPLCRVCHCSESDLRGESALAFLGILPPSQERSEIQNLNPNSKSNLSLNENCTTAKDASVVELVSPDGEIFVCNASDIEAGPICQEDSLIDLGCSCKNELSLAHYACALKWFVSHGSTICEICGTIAKNIRMTDFKKVLASLKDYDELRTSIITGGLTQLRVENGNTGVDPDAVAGIRRQRLSEISSWFNPRNSSSVVAVSQGQDELHVSSPSIGDNINNGELWRDGTGWDRRENMRRGLEGTGAFVAVGLILAILAWLLAPHVSKTAAFIGIHLLLGVLCSLTLVIFLRFVVPRAKYGPTRYWVVSFAFLFLVFGVWVSRTRNIRSS
ncbi:RING/FYVE/PHD zinc finger superfamily protein [Rhynchospora pubera]|uniref:RING/FYVE/PHD zinc finger superfamily protein n=1 Tax=Rhynchospora pubera TaxID=906938 RepID=A0AAV8F6W5_9POAL|nr:RING/FYVE/PHD zinc finger superfamily protein [Rhynchospora pubera]